MDTDFEQQYQAAERAYGLGDYSEAQALTTGLWEQLQIASDEQDQNIALGWRAVVALLQGHIQLHGLDQPDLAARAYQRVLDNAPEATIAALAEHGLERCRSQNSTNKAITTAVNAVPIPDLLKDPFLTTDPDQTKPEQPNQITAMPWLTNNEEPRPTPTTTPAPNPARSPEPTVTPEAMARPTAQPESRSEQPPKIQPPRNAEEPTPLGPTPPEPTPPETASEDLLKTSWLRVQLKPKPASPTDATKPMGLINRIKQSFARSAGR